MNLVGVKACFPACFIAPLFSSSLSFFCLNSCKHFTPSSGIRDCIDLPEILLFVIICLDSVNPFVFFVDGYVINVPVGGPSGVIEAIFQLGLRVTVVPVQLGSITCSRHG